MIGGFVGLALGTMRLPAMLLIGMPTPSAGGTNILVSGLIAMSWSVRHLREGQVDRRIVLVMNVQAFACTFIGGFGSESVSESLLILLVGLLVFWEGVELLARGQILVPGKDELGCDGMFTRKRMVAEGLIGLSGGLLGSAGGLILGSIRLPS